jgi:hypothetical protein
MTLPIRLRLAICVAAAALLWPAVGAAQSTAPEEAVFHFTTDVMVGHTGYVLPPGEYTLKRVDATEALFRLYRGPANETSTPLAILDTWDTRWPQALGDRPADTEATVKILEPRRGESARSLDGFTIAGDYYKIRDVEAVNMKAFSNVG